MKIVFVLMAVVSFQFLFAQAPEVSRDTNGEKILKGFMSKKDLAGDSAFAWFAENQKGYTPYAAALQSLKNNKDSLQFLVRSEEHTSELQSQSNLVCRL